MPAVPWVAQSRTFRKRREAHTSDGLNVSLVELGLREAKQWGGRRRGLKNFRDGGRSSPIKGKRYSTSGPDVSIFPPAQRSKRGGSGTQSVFGEECVCSSL